MDWTIDDLNLLSNLDYKFTGVSANFEVIYPKFPSYHSSITSDHDFCTADFYKYSAPNDCSLSWATTTIAVAEAALNQAGHPNIRLSVNQLIDCMPVTITGDSCRGFHPKDIADYIVQYGLIEESEYAKLSTADKCKEHDNLAFSFSAEIPERTNRGGLMNLISNGVPVMSMLALNLEKIQFIRDMRTVDITLRSGGYQPSIFASVVGYDMTANMPYWEIATNIIPCENITLRIPMTNNERDSNYAGIAAFAFGLKYEPLGTVVADENRYASVEDTPVTATGLVLTEGSYPIQKNVSLSGRHALRSIVAKSGALPKGTSFVVNDMPSLVNVTINEGCLNGEVTGRRLSSANSLIFWLRNVMSLKNLIISSDSCTHFNQFIIESLLYFTN